MKAIVIGASSGIGRELAKILAKEGYQIGLVARRKELLVSLQTEIQGKTFIKQVDVSMSSEAMKQIEMLIHEMGGVDLAILSSGVGYINPDFDWTKDKETIEVNVFGFSSLTNVFMKHFLSKGNGHLVGISSVAAVRGSRQGLVYNASKAFISNYLEGLRHKVSKERKQIIITDVKPGFVDTAMAKGDGLFWVTPVDKAAAIIYKIIKKKKSHAYISPRWGIVAWLLKKMPKFLYDRLV